MAATLTSIAVTFACAPSGWRVVDTGDERNLRDVFVSSPKRTLAAGDDGRILEFDGHEVVDTSTPARIRGRPVDFYGIASLGAHDVVAGDGGMVLVREEQAFTRVPATVDVRLHAIIAAADDVLYVAGEDGRVARRDFSSDTWTSIDLGAPTHATITSGWASSDDDLVFATDRGVVIDSRDGRWVSQTVATETATTPLPLFGIASFAHEAETIAVGLGGSIFHRAAKDGAWLRYASPFSSDLYDVFATARDRAFAVGADGAIARFDGTAWESVPSGTGADLFAIDGTQDGALTVAVGANGTMVVLEE